MSWWMPYGSFNRYNHSQCLLFLFSIQKHHFFIINYSILIYLYKQIAAIMQKGANLKKAWDDFIETGNDRSFYVLYDHYHDYLL